MRERVLLLSLHDVTPCHAGRLARAEALFRSLGVTAVTYLLVPRYHGGWPVEEEADFLRWCRAPRPFGVRWCLHGYHHQEIASALGRARSIDVWLKRQFLTAGEGEFLTLGASDAGTRIDRGRTAYKACLGDDPVGFVAPAWLFNQTLLPLLIDRDFLWTEDYLQIHDLRRGTALDAPVITWASRTRGRRWGSTWLAPRLLRFWHDSPILRLAVHPRDFDHASIIDAIRKAILQARQDRTFATYENVLDVYHRAPPEGRGAMFGKARSTASCSS